MIIKKKIILLFSLFGLLTNLSFAENINSCIKNAVENGIELNRILSLCKDNIKNINIYSNTFDKKKKTK